MASLPTGSNKILEIITDKVNVVIKSKKTWSGNVNDRSSSVVVEGYNIRNIRIPAINEDSLNNNIGFAQYNISLPPVFFEQTDYEIIVKGINHTVSVWNDNYSVRDKITPVIEGDNSLVTGIINFENSVGYSNLDIYVENSKHLSIRIEVFPTKISYKEDYQLMIKDISEIVSEAALDFMGKTYQLFSISDTHSSVLSVYFQILNRIFEDFINAINRIIMVPHHKLISEHMIVEQHKAKRTDRKSEKWLLHHQEYMSYNKGILESEKVLSVKKTITYDTEENRFVKYVLVSVIRQIELFKKCYQRVTYITEQSIFDKADSMIKRIRRTLNSSFFSEVSSYSALTSMSLVFGMAPGYRELYKYYIILQHGLSVNGDIFNMSPKDTAQLYEYWCFIKLFCLLKKEYNLQTPDIIRVDNNGITISLYKGKKSEARFLNKSTGEVITLIYNPGENKTQTVNQRPDNVLELEKNGTDITYKYVFDAKYRIENAPEKNFYPDVNPGPKVDDINTMHRYRDSIVYENKNSKFMFEKTMFGAYILFPYNEEEKYKEHRFYKSISTVNIGGLPFLPGSTTLVQKLLLELIGDSKESAFERTTLPRGIEEKLSVVDWEKRDVLIATFKSIEQFDLCFENLVFYIPENNINKDRFPIHYIALYQTNSVFGEEGEIRYYGEVVELSRVLRKEITDMPIQSENGEEEFFKILVKEWKDLTNENETGMPIKPKESGTFVEFTNLFLLMHSEIVSELRFKNEEEFRFYKELKRTASKAKICDGELDTGFEYGKSKFVFSKGEILLLQNGEILARVELAEFGRKPSQVFRTLQYLHNAKFKQIEKKDTTFIDK